MLRPSAPSAPMPRAVGVLDALDPLDDARRTTSTNDAPTATMPTSEPWRGMRLPNSRITTNESAGISGIEPRVVEEEHRRQPFIVSTSSRSALCRLR